ncbi:hypothetical protein VPNG_01195 [Cytospora leucostoma]|uniref:Uncharacterized protein n=1 Tax=Cytospora leucostoma TaxID=1230097 RepID=A0A423XMR7_9PEZI|nr:hypothetical protein VPNG_01195 [Cytospora leucostoma]
MYATRAMQVAFRPTRRMMRPVPNEEQAAHTVSQRLRGSIKKVPVELWPLAVVVGAACVAAGFSITRHLFTDSTIRLKRQNRAAESAAHAHTGSNGEH